MHHQQPGWSRDMAVPVLARLAQLAERKALIHKRLKRQPSATLWSRVASIVCKGRVFSLFTSSDDCDDNTPEL